MGQIICVSGDICVDVAPKNENAFIKEIKKIKNVWGGFAFDMLCHTVNFTCTRMEGCDPFTDGIEKPLLEALEVAKKYDAEFDGSFNISSDCSDFDNITIRVDGTELSYENTMLANTSDKELIMELIKRGYVVTKATSESEALV